MQLLGFRDYSGRNDNTLGEIKISTWSESIQNMGKFWYLTRSRKGLEEKGNGFTCWLESFKYSRVCLAAV